MYTVSFYSFKGGVGRSMSLVNVAMQLASSGKRVLIVDFDLEAPGLTTFRLTAPPTECDGLVEYVTSYRTTGEAPSVKDFVYRAKAFESGGEVWVMPAGRHDAEYSVRLNKIDWRSLYEDEQGFIFFEDLKQQWSTTLEPDYVLIDSRTGHSDVEGICTRQLPDAVCFLFFPNDQNLQGLRKVVNSVRDQNKRNRSSPEILLHFVVSNVPDLDDEEDIVGHTLDRFQRELGYKELTARIHHYNSLALLDQEIFSLSRSKSRLAKEYRALSNALVSENLLDRSSAVGYLQRTLSSLSGSRPSASNDILGKCDRILELYPVDGDIITRVALVFEASGRVSDALSLLSGEQMEYDAKAYAARARLHFRLEKKTDAAQDIREMLDSFGAERASFIDAISYIPRLDEKLYEKIPGSRALASLNVDDRLFAAASLDGSRRAMAAQAQILEGVLTDSDASASLSSVRHRLGLVLIGLGEFERAYGLLAADRSEDDIAGNFNSAMAEWGMRGEPPRTLMAKVVQLDRLGTRSDQSPNYHQCLALANYLTGDVDKARAFLVGSRERMIARPRREFSAWTYSRVGSREFLTHLNELEAAIQRGDIPRPAFLDSANVLFR